MTQVVALFLFIPPPSGRQVNDFLRRHFTKETESAEKNLPYLTPALAQRSLVPAPRIIAAIDIHAAIDRLASAIITKHPRAEKIVLLGIANGGMELARRLSAKIPAARVGTLDISFHRDDIGRHPIPKEFAPTHIPTDVNGTTVVLIDDVLFSGRTVKAALDELFDHGRPAKVELAILVDRGGRRLPFAPDFCGIVISTTILEKVVVTLDAANQKRDSIRIEPISAPSQHKSKSS